MTTLCVLGDVVFEGNHIREDSFLASVRLVKHLGSLRLEIVKNWNVELAILNKLKLKLGFLDHLLKAT